MPPSACSKRPGAAGGGAGEGALLVAEELGLDQVARDRRHVDGDEGPLPALAVIVQRARDEFLAGAGFAGDHDRQVGRHQPRERAVDLLHRRRAADQRDVLSRPRSALVARRRPRPRQGPPDDGDELLQVEGLRQVLVGAALGRLDRRHEGVLRAHDDDRQLRPQLLDPRQEVEGVLVRHHHVGDDEIALALRDPAPEGRGVAGRAHLVAGARQRLVEHRPDGGVVVGERGSVRSAWLSSHMLGCRARRRRGTWAAECGTWFGAARDRIRRSRRGRRRSSPPRQDRGHSLGLGGHEGVEEVGTRSARNAGAVVAHR